MRSPAVRLDSFDPERGGRSFGFRDPVRTLQANDAAEVRGLVREMEEGVATGLHAVGFFAYEAAAAFDPALKARTPVPGLPLAWFTLFRERDVGPGPPPEAPFTLGPWAADVSDAAYDLAFTRIRALLAAGESYQVNYTLRLRASFSGNPAGLYARLCRAQRSAYCAFLDIGSHTIVSASPELFFHWGGDRLTLRPMKGTRPRGRWPAEDVRLEADLIASPKERSENLMIVDLLRNDAGRIAVPGSVHVQRMFEVERYETVHQLTSTIEAQTRPEVALWDLLAALFPCGSVTGAPKVRTMEIIAAEETSPRGVYCGAIGMVSPGEAIFSVGIRTVVVDRTTGTAELGVGSGITWDATAEDEYRECLGKAAFASAQSVDFDLLETILYRPDSGFHLLAPHLRRMGESARRLGFSFRSAEVLHALHVAVADQPVPLRVRLTLSRAGAPSVVAEPLQATSPLVVTGLSSRPVDSRDSSLFHKTTRRDLYADRREEHPDCEDVLLINERGELTESTIANLVLSVGGELLTPPLESGLLPGVFRAELLRAREVRECVLNRADLQRASEIWLVNSVRGWRRALLKPLA